MCIRALHRCTYAWRGCVCRFCCCNSVFGDVCLYVAARRRCWWHVGKATCCRGFAGGFEVWLQLPSFFQSSAVVCYTPVVCVIVRVRLMPWHLCRLNLQGSLVCAALDSRGVADSPVFVPHPLQLLPGAYSSRLQQQYHWHHRCAGWFQAVPTTLICIVFLCCLKKRM